MKNWNRTDRNSWYNWYKNRVRTLLSSSNSRTFYDLFKFSMTLGLVVTFKNFHNFSSLGVFFDLSSSTDTNSGVHHNVCRLHTILALSPAVTKLPYKTLIFHDFQEPTIKFHDFPGLEKGILKLHAFTGFPWPVQTLENTDCTPECNNE